jgi:2-keto-4-pentenoate hydratase/2-oxohepta-3-ene-1,7-dioic acid hydratase in catechol pathway
LKFVRFETQNDVSYGLLENELVHKLNGDIFGSYEKTNTTYKLSEVKLLPPCMPTKIVAVGINYRDHATEMKHQLPLDPIIFIKPNTAVIGHEDYIELTDMSEQVDYEGELALVISKKARNVEPEDAFNYILGGSCFNDVTARDLQSKDGQWTRAKSFDTFAPFGPCITTDLNYNNLELELLLNGEVKQKSNTSYFINNANKVLSYISKVMTLNPGDIIATGTPAGVGRLREGDVVEVRIEGIGTLRNYVK